MKTISKTCCKRFDNSCYHHQCIANRTAVILLQVLTVIQAKLKNSGRNVFANFKANLAIKKSSNTHAFMASLRFKFVWNVTEIFQKPPVCSLLVESAYENVILLLMIPRWQTIDN